MLWKFNFWIYNSGSFFVEGTQVKCPCSCKMVGSEAWSSPLAPVPAGACLRKLENGRGSKIQGQGWRNVGAGNTYPHHLPAGAGAAVRQRTRAVQGKVGVESAVHRSQPSTNPHHLPGFKSLNSPLAQFRTLQGVPAKPMPKDIVHHLLFTSSTLWKIYFAQKKLKIIKKTSKMWMHWHVDYEWANGECDEEGWQ